MNRTGRSGQNEKEIDEEEVGSAKEKDEDPDSNRVTGGATFGVRLRVGDHACAGGHDVDGQEEEAVDDREGRKHEAADLRRTPFLYECAETHVLRRKNN